MWKISWNCDDVHSSIGLANVFVANSFDALVEMKRRNPTCPQIAEQISFVEGAASTSASR
jgi:hypothetical protein